MLDKFYTIELFSSHWCQGFFFWCMCMLYVCRYVWAHVCMGRWKREVNNRCLPQLLYPLIFETVSLFVRGANQFGYVGCLESSRNSPISVLSVLGSRMGTAAPGFWCGCWGIIQTLVFMFTQQGFHWVNHFLSPACSFLKHCVEARYCLLKFWWLYILNPRQVPHLLHHVSEQWWSG